MAITLKGQPGPGSLLPVFNPLWYYFDSTNKSKDGFRYLFDLYDAGTSTFTRFTPPPRPGDGYGQLDIAPIVQCRMSFDAVPGSLFGVAAKNSYFRYDLKIGEEYMAAFTYTGYAELTGSGTPYDGRVRLNGLTAHTFVVGDQIEINQTDGGVAVPLLQSLFTVVNVPNSSSVVIDLPYYLVSGSPAMGGTIYYSDRRKVQVTNLLTVSGITAYNGAVDVKDFNGYDFVLRQMTAATGNKKFLTTMPNGFMISPTADVHLNIGNMGSTEPYYVQIITSEGETFRVSINPDTTSQIMQVPAGPNDFAGATVVSGLLPVIKDTTTFYTVQITNSTGTAVSELRTFNIDRRCDRKDIHLLFMDRQGSLASMAFPLQAMFDNDFEKVVYEPRNGGFDATAQKFQYNLQRGGKTTIHSHRLEGLTLTTNWIPWDNANYLGELLGSPFVLVRLNGVYQACDVVTLTQPIQHPNKKKLINRVVQIKFSNTNPINV